MREGRWPADEKRDICGCVVCGGEEMGKWGTCAH